MSQVFQSNTIRFISVVLLGLGFFLLVPTIAAAQIVWNATDWTSYDTITIDATQVDDDLTDFPVYVDLGDLSADFWSSTPIGSTTVGTDIRVTTDSGSPVELPRELVSASSTAQTGELHFKANSISSTTDTVFRIYYNGTTTGDYEDTSTYGAENVWSNDYFAAWHLAEDPSGTAPQMLDSTSNGNNGTTNGTMTSADSVSGQLGNALDFDGTDDGVGATDVPVGSTFTYSTWVYVHSGADNTRIMEKWNGTGDEALRITAFTTNFGTPDVDINFRVTNDGGTRVNTTVNDLFKQDTWAYLVLKWNGTNVTAYVNDQQEFSGGLSGTLKDTSSILNIGYSDQEIRYFDGLIDETRISSTSRSTAWSSAEYSNHATTTDFYTIEGFVGSSTLANHDAGQVDNAFSIANAENEPLFAFNLTPETGDATVSEVSIQISGVRDIDNDAAYDVSDTVLDSGGVLSIDGQSGTLTFSTDFESTAAQNYLVVADWNAPDNGAQFTLSLPLSGLTFVGDHEVFGGVSAIQHNRNTFYSGGGGGGGSAAVGGAAPEGAGEQSGGGQDAGGGVGEEEDGDNIADDPEFYKPANEGTPNDTFTDPTNAFASDNADATSDASERHSYSGFGLSIPGGNEIEGIEVKLDGAYTGTPGTFSVYLSWNTGSNYTSAKTTVTVTDSDAVYTLGSPTDTWGRSWSPGEFGDGNLVVDVETSQASMNLDAIQINVYHQAGGGGQGGGGGGGGGAI